jgi:cytochrome c6
MLEELPGSDECFELKCSFYFQKRRLSEESFVSAWTANRHHCKDNEYIQGGSQLAPGSEAARRMYPRKIRALAVRLIAERNIMMSNMQKSATNNLLVTILATAAFLGSTELGLGQAGNSSGADAYKTNCVSCHAVDGRGSSVGKSLHAADFHSSQVQQQSDAQLTDVIKNGRGNMPSFGRSLSQAQVDALVKYIRTFKSAK